MPVCTCTQQFPALQKIRLCDVISCCRSLLQLMLLLLQLPESAALFLFTTGEQFTCFRANHSYILLVLTTPKAIHLHGAKLIFWMVSREVAVPSGILLYVDAESSNIYLNLTLLQLRVRQAATPLRLQPWPGLQPQRLPFWRWVQPASFAGPRNLQSWMELMMRKAAQHDSQHEQESMESQAHSEDAELSENDLATSVEESRHST